MKKLPILLVALSLMFGCDYKEESIHFLEPQPGHEKDLFSFNKKFRGNYIHPEDSTQLIITADKIIKISNISFSLSKQDVDDSLGLKESVEQQLKAIFENDKIRVTRISNDSIFSVLTSEDTIFNISYKNVFRFYKGAAFLNYADDNETWKVLRMDLDTKRLSIGLIAAGDSLFNALQVTDKRAIVGDSSEVKQYQIKPSKKELKKLIKENAFEEKESWIKVN